ncbi:MULTISPECIES: holin [Burkholderia]|uniref:holin n=1 Tax=Burkholderia TaxID=32008 RepID=UPI000752A08A|nr:MULTISPECIES: holin [Burkholderia]AOJ73515.1 holin [Burkholderia savannae]KVG38944.1 holin [Burkholderia sp. MSMB0265]KVG81669.1 holin [Burkholderia sp. MSMB2040]KVG98828.1 holin [Burkholderia sp. MSMB2042]KVG99007.1 holin [Burkholderia sp. MSMB2041]
MQIGVHEKELLVLLGIGAAIGLGKLLTGIEPLSARMILGGMVTGAALSASAGAVLILFQELTPTALVGVAAAIGLLGQPMLEKIAHSLLGKIRGDKEKDSDTQ